CTRYDSWYFDVW
nr:immunoglobulin heavy chain junction region [Mus musculus]MBK4195139.1 immunoglobulin heavy chain junction region [Mus musculus]